MAAALFAATLNHGLVAAAAFFTLGFGVGRSWVAIAPVAYWTVYGLGQGSGWWDAPHAESLVYGTVTLSILALLATAAGIWLRGSVSRQP